MYYNHFIFRKQKDGIWNTADTLRTYSYETLLPKAFNKKVDKICVENGTEKKNKVHEVT